MTIHNPSGSVTIKNLEAAFAGESMAHTKYRYFAKVCRAHGDEASARLFDDTADQEVLHALGHLDLLMPASELTPAKCLELAIEGETYEYTEMYPQFRHLAEQEGNAGDPEHGIAAGTRWDDVPENWECPDCGVAKADFEMVLVK